jgi:O-antigen ligase
MDASGSRANVYPKFAQMALERPSTGFGPGTFPAFGDSYLEGEPILRYQHFEAAHQDYLQTVIEWGWVGTFFWALLLVPPLVFLLRAALRSPRSAKRTFEGYRIGWADHLGAFLKGVPDSSDPCIAAAGATAFLLTALHALVDFPMQIASIQLYFLTIAALGWSLRKPPQPSTDFVEND